jgi:hypothetical protein
MNRALTALVAPATGRKPWSWQAALALAVKPLRWVGLLASLCAGLSAVILAGCASPAPDSPPCELSYRITPHYAAAGSQTAGHLEVTLRFAAEGRSETLVRGTPSWAGVDDYHQAQGAWAAVSPGTVVQARAEPWQKRVTHPAHGEVAVSYQVQAALANPHDGKPQPQTQLYRVQVGENWFQAFGYGLLVVPEVWDDKREGQWCITVAQPTHPDRLVFGSHHLGRGEKVSARVQGSHGAVRHAFYAGGPGWRLAERPVLGGVVHVAQRGAFEVGEERFATEVARVVDAQRRFWHAPAAGPVAQQQGPIAPEHQWVVMTPNYRSGSTGGTLVKAVAALHVEPSFSPSHGGFEFLVAHENLHLWIPSQFGTMPQGAVAEVADYWFSEGFTNFYTHRLLLLAGQWDLPRYGQALSQVLRDYWRSPERNATAASIAPRFFSDQVAGRQMYLRGELLALRWDADLRRQGHAGLDAVMRGLLLPGAAARETPLASQRLLQALQPMLGASPAQAVQSHIERGQAIELTSDILGPCFQLIWKDEPRWELGFDRASFDARQLKGLLPDGPAARAGLQEGMELVGWSVRGGDVTQPAEIQVRLADPEPGTTTRRIKKFSYVPVQGSESLPAAQLAEGASSTPACKAWAGGAPGG